MNKVTKAIICAVAVVLVIVAIVICVSKVKSAKPATAIDNFVKALNDGDFAKAKEYSSDDTMDILGVDEEAEDLEMVKLYYKNIEVKVNSVTKSKNTAVATVEITNKDLGKVLNNYMKKAQELALAKIQNKASDSDMENELLEYFKAQFESDEIETITTTVDVVINKVDGKWKVVVDDALRNALLPGLYSLANLFAA